MKLVEGFIKKIKGDSNYKIDSHISSFDLLKILYSRITQAIRGTFIRFRLKKSNGLIFASRMVKIDHSKKISTGSNLILEHGVYINGLSKTGIKFGKNVTIQRNTEIRCTGVIKNLGHGIIIGNDVGINSFCFIGGQGGVIIGDYTIIGHGVKIYSENHIYENLDIKIKLQGEKRKKVSIGENCWIGANSVILSGVEIGEGCIIAAGAVVNKSFPSNSIIGGVPAKLIKQR